MKPVPLGEIAVSYGLRFDLVLRVSVDPSLGKTAVGLVALVRWSETFRQDSCFDRGGGSV